MHHTYNIYDPGWQKILQYKMTHWHSQDSQTEQLENGEKERGSYINQQELMNDI